MRRIAVKFIRLVGPLMLLFVTLFGGAGIAPISHAAIRDIMSNKQHTAAASPHLSSATYLGGGETDYGRAVGLDAQGNIYLAGDSFSSSILGYSLDPQGGTDIVVAKLSPDASTLLELVSIGSTSGDHVGGMAVTPQGEVVLAINTDSASFPTYKALHATMDEDNPGVLLKINAAMDDLVFSTFTDFTVPPELHTVAVDTSGAITVAGYVYNPSNRARDLALERFSADGQQQLFGKVWDNDDEDERAQGLVVTPDGTTYVAGYTEGRWGGLAVTDNALQKLCGRRLALGADHDCDNDAFVMRLNPEGEVDYATYLGGNGDDKAVDIAVDGQGAMYLTGWAGAQDFPTTANAFQPRCRAAKPEDGCYYDMFAAKIAPDGSKLIYSTYLASGDLSGLDYPKAIAVDAAGNATVVGYTASERWPVKNAFQSALNAAPCPNAFQDRLCFDSVVTTFTPDGQLAFSSYLGGKFDEYSSDVMLGADGSIYLTGTTESTDFPATAGSVQPGARSGSDMFLARITTADTSPTVPDPVPGSQRIYLPLMRR